MNITLKQIRAFLAIARLGSFTRAGAEVHSTQSSLSVLIKELETELGARLMDRTTRKVELTEAGREFLYFGERIINELEHAVAHTRELTSRRRGRVTVAAPLLFVSAYLPHAVAAFRASHPGIVVNLLDLRAGQIAERVASGLVDCGVGVYDADDRLERLPLLRERLVLVCPSDHPLTHKNQVEWKDLSSYPVITIKGDDGDNVARQRELDQQLKSAGINLKPAIEVRNMMTMLGLVDANLGVAIWPSWATSLLRAYDIKSRPLIKPTVSHMVSIVTPKDRATSPAGESFITELRAFAKARTDGDQGAVLTNGRRRKP